MDRVLGVDISCAGNANWIIERSSERAYGWTRFDAQIAEVNGRPQATLTRPAGVELTGLRIYARPLRTYEAIDNARAAERR